MNIKRALLGCGLLIACVLVSASAAHAATVKTGDSPMVGEAESVNGTLYISGATIKIEGNVKGDVFCAGQTVEITGSVEGDVICAAQNLTIGGQVDGDIRAAAQTLKIEADVSGSATLFGQTVTVTKESTVGRDVTVYAQTLSVDGAVARDITGGGQFVTLNSKIGRDVEIETENLRLESDATVAGSLIYTSAKDAVVIKGASVAGATNHKEPTQSDRSRGELFMSRVRDAVYFFVSLLLLGAVLRWLVPASYGQVRAQLVAKPWTSMALGAGVLFATPIVAVVLAFTGVGFPVGALMILLWGLVLLAGMVYGSYGLGHLILRHSKQPSRWLIASSLAAGLAVLAVLMLVPIVGGFVTAIVLLWGIGGVVRTANARRQHAVQHETVREQKAKA